MLPIPAAFFLFLPFFLDQTTAYNPNKSPSRNAVLLSNIQTLTLHANRKTSHRRVSAIPQLTCVGPSKRICSLYIPDVMRCTNQGYDYDENDIQWTCTAELPPEFKLGSTEVVCEGYRDSNDPWILKGSCGVEYRMLLTEEGERKFPYMTGGALDDRSWAEQLWDFVKGVGTIFIVMGTFIALMSYCNRSTIGNVRGAGGWFGGGGGGGWGPPGPPPPYDYHGRYTKTETWQPGFWSGALAGGLAGYGLGNRRSSGRRTVYTPSSSGSSSAGPSNWTRESTGFGGTRRR
ncbi:uncharacterized protein CIMG_02683 [Coccidioides immitis RS]|uniref:Store-operated calcium entry-associated regulatory factor n=1 Tax=Coccidioides immitis (strain RS) TaxID=246410 RepID=A0A0E1S5Q4_COCIM|nr:uncharacterized protein CIMG_02683 [Coccidioides immitis RS]EAS37329.2 hypothetical protein CIMG_02683 [Coccidioides immitis RS]TPX24710.1 hypothetical protein DIZ76_010145 [Coccidioides immitis]